MHNQALVLNCNKCDIICEKLPYGGTDILGRDQTQRVMRGVRSGPTIFVAQSGASTVNILCHSLCRVNHKYYHKRLKTADLG